MSQRSISPLTGVDGFLPALASACPAVAFEAGDVLRSKGQHYREMYLLTQGAVVVDRGVDRARPLILDAPGTPVGEISFLRGYPATATVTAHTRIEALVVDDPLLARLEHDAPSLTASLLQHLAHVAEERVSSNMAHDGGALRPVHATSAVEVHLCRTPAMLHEAQRLRYDVYCTELGRRSPFANETTRTISDELDGKGLTFIAREAGVTIGTLRANLAADGPLGALEDLYGMRRSPHHPAHTAICTKFIVRPAKRGGPTAFTLIAAVVQAGLRHGVCECFIDCIPGLLPYYKAMGFSETGPAFMHRENGPSVPMYLDLSRHGRRLSRGAGPRTYARLLLLGTFYKCLSRLNPHGPRPAAT
ncbi:MAG: cyclic nucleotide-binding domain-containing protein [Vicinamibacterales bacterium]